MESIFTDIDKTFNYLLSLVGETGVKRDGKFYDFRSYQRSQVFIALMTERWIHPDAKAFFEDYSLAREMGEDELRNRMYMYMHPTGLSPLKPGDIFIGADEDKVSYTALCLKVNESGEPVEWLGLWEKDYKRTLKHYKGRIVMDSITESFTPDIKPSQLDTIAGGDDFWGEGKDMFYHLLAGRAIKGDDVSFNWGGEEYQIQRSAAYDMVSLAWKAPLWLKLRLYRCNSLEWVKSILNTMGEGIRQYDGKESLPPGAVLVLNNALAMLVSNKSNSQPHMKLISKNYKHHFERVAQGEILGYWIPSTEAAHYIQQPSTGCYTDLNKYIGHLMALPARVVKNDEHLFKHPELLLEEFYTPEYLQFLRQGSSSTLEWVKYCSDKGKGLQNDPQGIRPGDLLFIRSGSGLSPAIAAYRNKMLTIDHTYDKFIYSELSTPLYYWQPSLTDR